MFRGAVLFARFGGVGPSRSTTTGEMPQLSPREARGRGAEEPRVVLELKIT